MVPERELGVDPLLDRDEPQLLEPLDLAAGELLVREVAERVAAPERERGLERLERLGRLAGGIRAPPLLEQPLERRTSICSGSTSRT